MPAACFFAPRAKYPLEQSHAPLSGDAVYDLKRQGCAMEYIQSGCSELALDYSCNSFWEALNMPPLEKIG